MAFDGLGAQTFYMGMLFKVQIAETPTGVQIVINMGSERLETLPIEEAKKLRKALGQAITSAKARNEQEHARRARGLIQDDLFGDFGPVPA